MKLDRDTVQGLLDAAEAGDHGPVFETFAENIIVENGPGAGPWRIAEGRDQFADVLIVLAFFNGTFHRAAAVSMQTTGLSSTRSRRVDPLQKVMSSKTWPSTSPVSEPTTRPTDCGPSTWTPRPASNSGVAIRGTGGGVFGQPGRTHRVNVAILDPLNE